MNENRKPRIVLWAAVAFAILAGYALSIGPACWLIERGIVSRRHVGALYNPLLSLEFRAPHAMQEAVSCFARLWQAEAAFTALRNEPVWRRYPVGDLAYRLENGRRVFYSDEWLYNMITTTFEPDSWDDLSGPGTLRVSAATESLEVLQSRRVHTLLKSYLNALRERKQVAAARGRELDLPSLFRALDKDDGIFPDDEIRPDVVVITNRREGRFAIGDRDFAGVDAFIEFLGHQPRGSMRAGILLGELFHVPGDVVGDGVRKRVKQFCESRDIDLFVKPTSIAWGNPDLRIRWAVQSSDSVYDPD